MGSFLDAMKDALNDGLEISKDLASKAGAKAQELGEKGVITLEIKKLELNGERLLKALGRETYRLFSEGGRTEVSSAEPEIARLLREIENTKGRIEEKQAALRGYGG
ncbi:MAG: hypothetical protein LBD20_04920 [Spirochaetaceae bacterium]|jgi:hypothetical protein|nr:hypothetical protein [Spirochaetaceae bacterium]